MAGYGVWTAERMARLFELQALPKLDLSAEERAELEHHVYGHTNYLLDLSKRCRCWSVG